MHPSQEQLRLYVENRCNALESEIIKNHLAECSDCHSFCENYRDQIDSIDEYSDDVLPKEAEDLANRLYFEALRCSPIPLSLMRSEEFESGLALAADGESEPEQHIHSIATLYSDDPEIVLRIMRDPEQGFDYMQLICDNDKLVSGAMVQIPELEREILTDDHGYAKLDSMVSDDFMKLKWQIKLPDAVFHLDPLIYDPEQVLYSQETILTSDKNDRIKVKFEGKTEGKQISISILELNGKSDFENIKVIISQKDSSRIKAITVPEDISFKLTNTTDHIIIRLFI